MRSPEFLAALDKRIFQHDNQDNQSTQICKLSQFRFPP